MTITVLELRNYLLKPDALEHFIDYFEAHFIASQQAVGMSVLGQFRAIAYPDHFVWLRGFTDMAARLNGLTDFYGGAFWAKHRHTTNNMILDNDDVLLLRPLSDIADLTCGVTAESLAADMAAGTIATQTGLIVVDRYRAHAGQRQALIESVQTDLLPLYAREGIQVRGLFVAETRENTYPRLPVIQNPDELVVITAHNGEAAYRENQAKIQSAIKAIRTHLSQTPEPLLLSPTLRSPIRYLA
ncbi:MAG: NIPSNAP family protein [Anaerolineae bacterium]|nr:NIPSNAP family protein [Anaerolineae bacterium]